MPKARLEDSCGWESLADWSRFSSGLLAEHAGAQPTRFAWKWDRAAGKAPTHSIWRRATDAAWSRKRHAKNSTDCLIGDWSSGPLTGPPLDTLAKQWRAKWQFRFCPSLPEEVSLILGSNKPDSVSAGPMSSARRSLRCTSLECRRGYPLSGAQQRKHESQTRGASATCRLGWCLRKPSRACAPTCLAL